MALNLDAARTLLSALAPERRALLDPVLAEFAMRLLAQAQPAGLTASRITQAALVFADAFSGHPQLEGDARLLSGAIWSALGSEDALRAACADDDAMRAIALLQQRHALGDPEPASGAPASDVREFTKRHEPALYVPARGPRTQALLILTGLEPQLWRAAQFSVDLADLQAFRLRTTFTRLTATSVELSLVDGGRAQTYAQGEELLIFSKLGELIGELVRLPKPEAMAMLETLHFVPTSPAQAPEFLGHLRGGDLVYVDAPRYYLEFPQGRSPQGLRVYIGQPQRMRAVAVMNSRCSRGIYGGINTTIETDEGTFLAADRPGNRIQGFLKRPGKGAIPFELLERTPLDSSPRIQGLQIPDIPARDDPAERLALPVSDTLA